MIITSLIQVTCRHTVSLAMVILALVAGACVYAQPKGAPMKNPVVRETYEWSNIWWDHANDTKLPRVLLIGDSISVGYSPLVTKLLAGEVHVDRLGTSRSINDPVLIKETTMMLEDHSYLAIHFNNGLHGLPLDGPAYAAGLKTYVALLKRLGGGAKLIWASSTPITKTGDPATLADNNEKVLQRNKLAAQIMQEQGIPTDDLYSLCAGKADWRLPDGYHYNETGKEAQAKAVAAAIQKELGVQ